MSPQQKSIIQLILKPWKESELRHQLLSVLRFSVEEGQPGARGLGGLKRALLVLGLGALSLRLQGVSGERQGKGGGRTWSFAYPQGKLSFTNTKVLFMIYMTM